MNKLLREVRIETQNEAAVYETLHALQRMANQMPDVKTELLFNISQIMSMMVYPERKQG